MRKILAIDGNSIMNRAFYGIRLLANKKGVYTNAIFGFLNILLKLTKEHNPTATIISFDLPDPTFRHKKYSEYKGTRKGMSEELAMQMPLIKEIIGILGIKIIEKSGYEADDILGTIGNFANQNKDICIIATGDRDCLQLISDYTFISLAKNKETILYDTNKMHEEYLYLPSQVIDIKALMGDASDNIPGVRGVGEKTAISLIANYSNLENIYDNIHSLNATKRLKDLLTTNKENAFLSKELATIFTDVPIDNLNDIVENSNMDNLNKGKLSAILKELEMFAFFDKFDLKSSDLLIETIETEEQLSLFSTPKPDSTAPLAVNKNIMLNPPLKDMTSLFNAGDIYYLYDGSNLLINADVIYHISEKTNSYMTALMNSNTKKYTFAAKPSYNFALTNTIDINEDIFDLELVAYLLSPSTKSYNIKELALRYLTGININDDNKYQNILFLPLLCSVMTKEITNQKLDTVLYDIELPLCNVLTSMEYLGFMVDTDGIKNFGETLNSKIEIITKQIYELAEEQFNINSTKELSVILFEKLGLKSGKKTKTGYSTSVEVLETLILEHPIIPLILEYRSLTKLHSTYVIGLLKKVSTDVRVHSTFNQTLTRTGRISSTEPNVQNIPIRTTLGSEIRKFFIAPDNYLLIGADYSQIELRVLASISNDSAMLDAFNKDEDIHTATASQVFNVPKDMVTSELRRRAKAINFGIVYGIGPFSLAQDIGTTYKEAKDYIEEYLNKYSGVNYYMRDIIATAKNDNYVTTLFGRRRDVSDINSTNKMTASFGERIALNTPIQGTAADIIKLAMIKVFKRLKQENLDAKLILQVHDELIIECHESISDTVSELLKYEMENCASLLCKMLVDVNIGKRWYDTK